jgi:hypothetical protein
MVFLVSYILIQHHKVFKFSRGLTSKEGLGKLPKNSNNTVLDAISVLNSAKEGFKLPSMKVLMLN